MWPTTSHDMKKIEKIKMEKVLEDVEGDNGNRDLHFIVGRDRYCGGIVEFWENN